MPHWAVKHGTQVLIGVLITALLSGIGYVAWHACKIPGLENKLKAHDDKLATISANLIILMSKSGPLENKLLKDLLSNVEEMGNAKAHLLANARVLEGDGTIPVVKWVPVEEKDMFTVYVQKGQTVRDKEKIAKIISAMTIAQAGTAWSVEGDELIAAFGTTKVAFTTEKKSGQKIREDLEKWVTELNHLSSAAAQIKKAGEDKKQ